MPKATRTHTEDGEIPEGINSIYPPILLLIVVGLIIYWSYDYGETARRLPLLISTGTLILIVLDLLSRFRGRLGEWIHLALGAGFQDREMQQYPRWQAEIMQFVWVACCVISMALIGILPTIPVFIFLYMVIQGKQKVSFSLMIAALILTVVGLVFEVFLEYDLYRGMLLNRDGFE